MTTVYTFSESEKVKFLEMWQWYLKEKAVRTRFAPGPSQLTAPDVYVAKTRAGGIPGMIPASSLVGTAAFDSPGEAFCDIFRLVEDPFGRVGTAPGFPELHQLEATQKRVYNLSQTPVPPYELFLAVRSKQGVWYVAGSGAEDGVWAKATSETKDANGYQPAQIFSLSGSVFSLEVAAIRLFQVNSYVLFTTKYVRAWSANKTDAATGQPVYATDRQTGIDNTFKVCEDVGQKSWTFENGVFKSRA